MSHHFFFWKIIFHYVDIPHFFYIHFLVDGHSDFSYFLVLVNTVALGSYTGFRGATLAGLTVYM